MSSLLRANISKTRASQVAAPSRSAPAGRCSPAPRCWRSAMTPRWRDDGVPLRARRRQHGRQRNVCAQQADRRAALRNGDQIPGQLHANWASTNNSAQVKVDPPLTNCCGFRTRDADADDACGGWSLHAGAVAQRRSPRALSAPASRSEGCVRPAPVAARANACTAVHSPLRDAMTAPHGADPDTRNIIVSALQHLAGQVRGVLAGKSHPAPHKSPLPVATSVATSPTEAAIFRINLCKSSAVLA